MANGPPVESDTFMSKLDDLIGDSVVRLPPSVEEKPSEKLVSGIGGSLLEKTSKLFDVMQELWRRAEEDGWTTLLEPIETEVDARRIAVCDVNVCRLESPTASECETAALGSSLTPLDGPLPDSETV